MRNAWFVERQCVRSLPAALAGDEQGIEDAYRSAMRSAEALSAWEDVQPETDGLYSMLTRRLAAAHGENA